MSFRQAISEGQTTLYALEQDKFPHNGVHTEKAQHDQRMIARQLRRNSVPVIGPCGSHLRATTGLS